MRLPSIDRNAWGRITVMWGKVNEFDKPVNRKKDGSPSLAAAIELNFFPANEEGREEKCARIGP